MARPRSLRSIARTSLLALALVVLAGCGGPGPWPSAATPPAIPGPSDTVEPTASPFPSVAPVTASATPSPATPTPAPWTPPPPTPAPPTPAPPTPTPQLQVGGDAWVAVTVATGWRSADAPRAADAPALENPARIGDWLAALTTDLQAQLIGRVDTQVLLGDRVMVDALQGAWARVVVPNQPTPLDGRGYPAWIPVVQLSPVAPRASPTRRSATITTLTAWLEDSSGTATAEASYGTRLPVLSEANGRFELALPGGRTAWINAGAVVVGPSDGPALPSTGAAMVQSARLAVGVRYLWGGTSGFGYDCSGLVHLVARVHGIVVPRDAGPQSRVGAEVAAPDRQPGDLLFFTRDAAVHHVAIWVGNGSIVEAPDIGVGVRVVALTGLPYAGEVSATRRVGG